MISVLQGRACSLAFLLFSVLIVNSECNQLQLKIVPETIANTERARCLDGSFPAYYLREGLYHTPTKWVIYLDGGFWCSDPSSCLARSLTPQGSSSKLPSVMPEPGGIISTNEATNDFGGHTQVVLTSCDGSLWSSDRTDPIQVANSSSPIYLRGRPNLVAQMRDLFENHGLDKATEVLFVGGSSGGLGLLYSIDALTNMFAKPTFSANQPPSSSLGEDTYATSELSPDASQTVTIKALIDSAFFLDYQSFTNSSEHKFADEMKRANEFWNATGSGSIPARCVASYPSRDPSHCMIPQYLAPYVRAPLFFLNSVYDSYDMSTFYGLGCSPRYCNAAQWGGIDIWRNSFFNIFRTAMLGPSPRAYYLVSCFSHLISWETCPKRLTNTPTWFSRECTGYSTYTVELDGSRTSPQQAVSDWFFDRTTSALVDKDNVGRNPTCP